ncbi:MAG: aldo/keto reductase [Gammaproteobacteria bacterium]|nr:aldo/keto reductase [Gammaproteobacteria bacterium]
MRVETIVSTAGVSSPRIIYGTAWKKSDTAHLVEQALTAGFRGIDTACQPKHYHESGVGDGIAACLALGLRREELYLQTKFTAVAGQDPRHLPYDAVAPLAEQVAQSFATSLHNLQTRYLDCLVLHSPLATDALTLEAWRAMERLVDAGGIRQLGISNCYRVEQLESLMSATRINPAIVQNRWYAKNNYDRKIRAFCREHRILYQSFWTLTGNPELLESKAVLAMAKRHRCSPVQVLFRYLTQSGVTPLTGTRSEAHMQEDLSCFNFQLAPEEMAQMHDLTG